MTVRVVVMDDDDAVVPVEVPQSRRDVGFAVVSPDAALRGSVVAVASGSGERCVEAATPEDLVAQIADALPRVIVVDHSSDETLVEQVAAHPARNRFVIVAACRELKQRLPPAAADVAVVESALPATLALFARGAPIANDSVVFDRIMAVSVLQGAIDRAVSTAADVLASALGVDHVIIALRDDASGSAVSGSRTFGNLVWELTAERCRAAVAAKTTLVTRSSESDRGCESYLAVPLDSHYGSGFISLLAMRPHVFGRSQRNLLSAIATRLCGELAWRSAHERSLQELSRALDAPGLDPQLSIWNRAALVHLAAMQASAARRAHAPLTVAVLDIVELSSINARYGVRTGDRVLQRIADALRATLRQEDVIGRWSGDEIAMLLPATTTESGERVATRIQAALAARSIEVPGGDVLPVRATLGVATLRDDEPPETALRRAAHAANNAQYTREPPADAVPRPTGRMQQLQILRESVSTIVGGEYRLLHEISRGGMGMVFRAEDLTLERPVAIKMLRPDFADDPGLLDRLRNEAAMLARINHPNLVQVYTFGQRSGESYLVMELVEGESLEQAFDRHAAAQTFMPLDELVTVVEQIASALDALHDRGVVHRDVKPANVIRDPFRARSVLVDVGIASRHGETRELSGTPGYIAPEVIRGQEATPRSDVYALAATTYALLTQALPFGTGTAMTVISAQLDSEPAAPSTLRAEAAPVDALMQGALDVDPARRPRSAGAFARAFGRALAPIATARSAADVAAPALAAHQTRGVVFRSVTRAIGVREAARLRDVLSNDDPELARVLADAAPLAWFPTALLVRLFTAPEAIVGRAPARFARAVAHSTVRASFRQFFPTTAATLVPERTLEAIRNVWSRYHDWGEISSMPVSSAEVVVRLVGTPRAPSLCEWTCGLLEQVLILSGAPDPFIAHETCEARGDEACLFRATWLRHSA